MVRFADVIVSFWFFPVMLFIVLPLLMLCGWAVFRIIMQRKPQPPAMEEAETLPGSD